MSLFFGQRTGAAEVDESEWVFVHEETCGPITYKDAVLSASISEDVPESRETHAHLEDTLNNENYRGPSARNKHKKRR